MAPRPTSHVAQNLFYPLFDHSTLIGPMGTARERINTTELHTWVNMAGAFLLRYASARTCRNSLLPLDAQQAVHDGVPCPTLDDGIAPQNPFPHKSEFFNGPWRLQFSRIGAHFDPNQTQTFKAEAQDEPLCFRVVS